MVFIFQNSVKINQYDLNKFLEVEPRNESLQNTSPGEFKKMTSAPFSGGLTFKTC